MRSELTDSHTVEIMAFLYFGYGSNLLRERLRIQNPSAVFVTTAVLEDHVLTFSSLGTDPLELRWCCGHATITERPGNSVKGCVWRLENTHLDSLDRQEGVFDRLFDSKQVDVITPDGEKLSYRTYQVPINILANKDFDNRPSPAYKDVILRGARQNQLPTNHLTYLDNIETNGSDKTPDVYKEALK